MERNCNLKFLMTDFTTSKQLEILYVAPKITSKSFTLTLPSITSKSFTLTLISITKLPKEKRLSSTLKQSIQNSFYIQYQPMDTYTLISNIPCNLLSY